MAPIQARSAGSEVLFGKDRVPGVKGRRRRCRRCRNRGCEEAAFAREEVKLEVIEGGLGKVRGIGQHLAGLGVGLDRSDQLGVYPKARGDLKEAVLIAGLWFTDVDGSLEAFGEGGAADREGADL